MLEIENVRPGLLTPSRSGRQALGAVAPGALSTEVLRRDHSIESLESPQAHSYRSNSQWSISQSPTSQGPSQRDPQQASLVAPLSTRAEKLLEMTRWGAEVVSAALISLIFILVLKGLLLTLIGEGL